MHKKGIDYYTIGRGAGMYIIPAPLPHGDCGVWGRAPIIKQVVFATIFTRITTADNKTYRCLFGIKKQAIINNLSGATINEKCRCYVWY